MTAPNLEGLKRHRGNSNSNLLNFSVRVPSYGRVPWGSMDEKKVEPPASRCSSEGELKVRLLVFLTRANCTYCTYHGVQQAGRASRLDCPSPLVPILIL